MTSVRSRGRRTSGRAPSGTGGVPGRRGRRARASRGRSWRTGYERADGSDRVRRLVVNSPGVVPHEWWASFKGQGNRSVALKGMAPPRRTPSGRGSSHPFARLPFELGRDATRRVVRPARRAEVVHAEEQRVGKAWLHRDDVVALIGETRTPRYSAAVHVPLEHEATDAPPALGVVALVSDRHEFCVSDTAVPRPVPTTSENPSPLRVLVRDPRPL